eukprot:1994909-Rhodomonas_salina.3
MSVASSILSRGVVRTGCTWSRLHTRVPCSGCDIQRTAMPCTSSAYGGRLMSGTGVHRAGLMRPSLRVVSRGYGPKRALGGVQAVSGTDLARCWYQANLNAAAAAEEKMAAKMAKLGQQNSNSGTARCALHAAKSNARTRCQCGRRQRAVFESALAMMRHAENG